MKHFLKETIKIIAILAIAIPTFAFLAGSWTESVQSPPGTNVDAPINVGVQAQTKEGGLWLNTLGAAVGLIVEKGNMGIGTVEPTQKLDVAGKIRIGNDSTAETAGTIRWNGTDFEGYDGMRWLSLTATSITTPATCPPGEFLIDFGDNNTRCLPKDIQISAQCSWQTCGRRCTTTTVTASARVTSTGVWQTKLNSTYQNQNSGWIDGGSAGTPVGSASSDIFGVKVSSTVCQLYGTGDGSITPWQ